MIDDDEDFNAPLSKELVLKILTQVFRLNDKTLYQDSVELKYDGGDTYTLKSSAYPKFDNLVFIIEDNGTNYGVKIVPDFQIQIISECKALGLSKEDGPEGFKEITDYPGLEDDLKDFTNVGWTFNVSKSDLN